MGKFFGTYERLLDEKGRLQLPTKLVEKGTKKLYMLRGFEGCISIYGEDEFNKLIAKLESLDYRNEEDRAYIRLTTASVNELSVDSHGRITLGSAIMNSYRIGSSVTLIGVLDHFEVWDAGEYARYLLKNTMSYGVSRGRN